MEGDSENLSPSSVSFAKSVTPNGQIKRPATGSLYRRSREKKLNTVGRGIVPAVGSHIIGATNSEKNGYHAQALGRAGESG